MQPAPVPNEKTLIDEAMPVVRMCARQMKRELGCPQEIDELESFGREGLLSAVRSFDASRGVPFRRWANLRIKGSIYDGIRSTGLLPRRVYQRLKAGEAAAKLEDEFADKDAARTTAATPEEADKVLGERLSDLATAMAAGFLTAQSEGLERVASDDDENPEDRAVRLDGVAKLRRAVEALDESERTLLLGHYFEDKTLEEAGKAMGLSKSWASRLHARAIQTLTERLNRAEFR